MKRAMHTITTPVEGDLYRALLGLACDQGFVGLLIEPPQPPLKESAKALLASLKPFEEKRAMSWPGTTLLKEEAIVHKFVLTDSAVKILARATDNIFGWLAPDLPEDLCVLRPDGTPWLVTIAHEGDAYFELSEDEVPILATLEGLDFRPDEPAWN
jgi:hypothetical protein